MKDWSELEDRYQDLHSTDAKGAEEFKHKMTNRYGILHHCVPSFSNYHLIGILSSSPPPFVSPQIPETGEIYGRRRCHGEASTVSCASATRFGRH
jgi:hypothetical protein